MATRQRGRPKVHTKERIVTAVRLDKDLVKRLKHEAIDRDVSVNLIVVKACEDWLKKNGGKKRV